MEVLLKLKYCWLNEHPIMLSQNLSSYIDLISCGMHLPKNKRWSVAVAPNIVETLCMKREFLFDCVLNMHCAQQVTEIVASIWSHSVSTKSSIIFNSILLQGPIAIICATANYTTKKVKVCDHCQNIIHEQKLYCSVYMAFSCACSICLIVSHWHNPLRVWSLLKLDIDISTNTSTSSVSKWPTRFKHI